MKYNCIIVDDEPHAIKILESYIRSLDQLNIVGTCSNGFRAINILNNEKIDLIFLDINMPKLLGTQLLKTLQYPPKVIFTTAHKDYAIEAFELDAIDYLLKPISFERFLKAVNKFCHTTTVDVATADHASGFLYFRADRKMVKVFLEDILYIESYKDYIVIHKKTDVVKVKLTISAVEKMLPKNLFLRIHRSFIVSTNSVTAYTKNDVEIGKIELPIGRNYSTVIKRLTDNTSIISGLED
ncbi:LytTR family DNA-binding domain-containing protein [Arenibacter sp. F26102]|uniref:LytR/AlgR family response regulator transcription factor n=1 Tax=Arenibacter sp. F26102 TaxID=2926416 RepID=UPI001FF4ECD8|nr:LytTR family DNA-binding domain-containing protein [Arenibacter sp. F26102]MCK0147629.1 LytTR family DNA-binding domain-containing protein [Arenibacter sp. F26102]